MESFELPKKSKNSNQRQFYKLTSNNSKHYLFRESLCYGLVLPAVTCIFCLLLLVILTKNEINTQDQVYINILS
jgi:hypothetical protein